MSAKKLAGYLHLWLGLASGIIVVIIGLTGSIYAFQEELKDIFYADKLFVTPHNAPVRPISELLVAAEKALGKGKKVTRVEIENKPDRAYIFRAVKTNPKKIWYGNYYVYFNNVYIDPYTGAVLDVENTKYEFFQVVLSIHRQLLLGETVGHIISCSAVSMFSIILISGLILWWPKKWSKDNIKNYVTVKWSAKFKKINYDMHRVLGLYAFTSLFIICTTGLIWSYDWFDHTVQFIANGGHSEKKRRPSSLTQRRCLWLALPIMYGPLHNRTNPLPAYRIVIPQKNTATLNVSIYREDGNRYDRVQQFYDQYTGTLLESKAFADVTRGEQLRLMNYDLHTGSVLGIVGKSLACLSGLIAAILPITGFTIWFNNRRKDKKEHKGKHKKHKKVAVLEDVPVL